jgi:hypothetical protein
MYARVRDAPLSLAVLVLCGDTLCHCGVLQALRSKLLFAIVNCEAIDADYTPSATQVGAWADL